MSKMAFVTMPQLQAAKLEATTTLSIGMIHSLTVEGISISLDAVEENEIEEDDG